MRFCRELNEEYSENINLLIQQLTGKQINVFSKMLNYYFKATVSVFDNSILWDVVCALFSCRQTSDTGQELKWASVASLDVLLDA